VALDRWDIDGSAPPAGDKKKALDDLLQALVDGAAATPPTVSAALAAAAGAYKAAAQAARELVDPLSSANREQVASQKSLDDLSYDLTTGDTCQNLAYARSALAICKTGITLFNSAVTLYGFVQDLKTKAIEEEAQWLKAIETYLPITPQAAPLAAGVGLAPQVPPEVLRHTLGSDGNTTVFGKKRLFLQSPVLVLSGSGAVGDPTADPPKLPDNTGKLLLLAETKALLLSRDTAEINGDQKTFVASNHAVEIRAENKVIPGQPATLKTESTGATGIKSDARIDVEVAQAANAGVIAVSTGADQSITLDQAAKKTTIAAYEAFELTATKTARLLAGASAVSLSLDAEAEGGTLLAKAGSWQLEMMGANGINLGKPGARLLLGASTAILDGGNRSQAIVQGKSVDLKASTDATITANGKILLG
jgi:hypothetical protein